MTRALVRLKDRSRLMQSPAGLGAQGLTLSSTSAMVRLNGRGFIHRSSCSRLERALTCHIHQGWRR